MTRGHARGARPDGRGGRAPARRRFRRARPHRGDGRSRLVHRHPGRPRAGPRHGSGAGRPGGRRLDPGRLRRAAAQRAAARDHRGGDRRPPRIGLFPAVRVVRPSALARRAATRCANACAAIGAGPALLAGDAAELVAVEAHRAGLPYDLAAAANAPDIMAVARIGLALDPAHNPARPLYIKPPDARPNPASRSPGPPREVRPPDLLGDRADVVGSASDPSAGDPTAQRRQGRGLRPPARRGLRPSVVGRGGRRGSSRADDPRRRRRWIRSTAPCAASCLSRLAADEAEILTIAVGAAWRGGGSGGPCCSTRSAGRARRGARDVSRGRRRQFRRAGALSSAGLHQSRRTSGLLSSEGRLAGALRSSCGKEPA